MPNMQVLLERNQHFASIFNQGNLPFLPRLSMLIVTCLDARVDPAHFLGLELGDAVVMRSIGGRVTDEIIEHIAIMRALSVVVGGAAPEVVVIHHTGCAASRFANPEVRQRLGRVAGTGEAPIERLAITDPQAALAEDLERLRAAPTLPDDLVVSGYVYDITDGHVREISASASLREAAR